MREIILGEKVSSLYQRMLYRWGKEKKIIVSFVYWENGIPTRIILNDKSFQTYDDVGIFK